MKYIKTSKELEQEAAAMRTSKWNRGEQILFCVDYCWWLSSNIHNELFSTAERALKYAETFDEDDYVKVYPVFDIWNNPKQVDIF